MIHFSQIIIEEEGTIIVELTKTNLMNLLNYYFSLYRRKISSRTLSDVAQRVEPVSNNLFRNILIHVASVKFLEYQTIY